MDLTVVGGSLGGIEGGGIDIPRDRASSVKKNAIKPWQKRMWCIPAPANDVEYKRNGVAHLLAFYAPFENWRRIDIADNHAAEQWAQGVRRLVQEDYPQAIRITLVMDNLNTHGGSALYKGRPV